MCSLKLRHVGIVCENIDDVLPFYLGLGMKVVYDQIEKVRIVKLDGQIELLQYESMGKSTLRLMGISHIAFTQDPENTILEIVTKEGKLNVSVDE